MIHDKRKSPQSLQVHTAGPEGHMVGNGAGIMLSINGGI